jgi:hypothetical protein
MRNCATNDPNESGRGWFVNEGCRHRVELHDVLFARAGAPHRFEEFSDDFLVWVFFYGPEGGEADPPR